MKRIFIQLLIGLLPYTVMQAQHTLQIEAIPGQLSGQLTEEQMATVEELTLTGDLDDSDFYFMRDKLPSLAKLDLKNTAVDTIPLRAFHKNESLKEVYLPLNLKYISEDAFTACYWSIDVYITGKFPDRAARIMDDECRLQASDDNNELYMPRGGIIYSADQKTLYSFKSQIDNFEFTEGLETIESYACADQLFTYLIFPSTLKEIKRHAFDNAYWTLPVGGDPEGNSMVIRAQQPPRLEKNAFNFDKDRSLRCTLIVPKGCSAAYRDANPQWEEAFESIEEGYYPYDTSSIHATSRQPFAIRTNNGTLAIENAGECRLCIYDIAGRCITDCIVENDITIENLPTGMYIYRLQGNNIAESGKFVTGN